MPPNLPEDPITLAQRAIAVGIQQNGKEVEDISNYLHSLRNDTSSASSTNTGAGQPFPPPPPQQVTKEVEAGRKLLLQYAMNAIQVAENQPKKSLRAQGFHTAVIYFDVLKSFQALPEEMEERLEYARWRLQQCSHLVENMVPENINATHCIEDTFIVHKDKILGKGTYGTVTVATHRGTNRRYACKVIKMSRLDPRQVSKLYTEIQCIRALDHPHIVRSRGVYFSKRYVYLLMDLMEGGELFDLVTSKPNHCATEAQIINMATSMLSAVAYMHARGIVHRDLKLENWLLESPGDTTSLKLIDFGLSKHFGPAEVMHQSVGSTYYVAPEVLQGEYNEKCDVWSLGVIVYMVISGAPPFWGKNDTDVRGRILLGGFEMPEQLFSCVSPDAKDFVGLLLQKDVSKRPTAEEALRHPWLQSTAAAQANRGIHGPLMRRTDLAEALRQFGKFSELKKLTLEVVAYNMAPQQLSSLRETFEAIDTTRTGSISLAEMARALRGYMGEKELQQLFGKLDVTHSQEINYNEFIASTIWTRLQLDEENLHEAFVSLDQEGRGFLTVESIRKVVGTDWGAAEVEAMIKEVDTNQDGKVDYNEFSSGLKAMALTRHARPLSLPGTGLLKKVRRTFGSSRGSSGGGDAAAGAGTGAPDRPEGGAHEAPPDT